MEHAIDVQEHDALPGRHTAVRSQGRRSAAAAAALYYNFVPQNNRPGSWERFATAEPCGPVRLSVGVPAVTERTRQDGRTCIAPGHAPTLRATQRAPAAAAGAIH